MSTLTLGGVTLDPSLPWVDRNASQAVAQSVIRTLGGGAIVQAASISVGMEITFQSAPDMGLMLWPTIQQLKALANQAGAVHELDVNGTTYSVMFRHDDPPAFDAEPLIPRTVPLADDYFRCTIKLITV